MSTNLFNVDALLVVLALAAIAERLVQWFVRPIFDRQKWDTFYLMYVGLVVGGVLSAACNQNLFTTEVVPPVVGLILTAVLCGGGSNLINQVTSRSTPADLTLVATPQSVTMTATGEGQAPETAIRVEDTRPVTPVVEVAKP